MMEPVSLKKQLQPPAGMDYKMLQREGIDLLQQLAGVTWTDYNAHDPGVTILEYLCYALNDLSYKTHFDIRDILEQHPARNGRLSDSFYPAYSVLNSHPVTPNDYRKLILDQFCQQVRNVWVTPSVSFHHRLISGHYQVSVQLKSEIYEGQNVSELARIRKDIWDFLRQHRGLGEDFPEPEILQPQEIFAEAIIDIHPDANMDDVYANIFHQLEQNVLPETPFHSFHEMMDAGLAIEDIFEGPLLQNGFILNSDLGAPCSEIYVSSLLKSVFSVEGVLHIRQFRLFSDGKVHDTILKIEEGKIPLLRINIKSMALARIRMFKSGVEVFPDASAVYREIEYIRAKNRRLFPFDLAKDPGLNASKGVLRNLHEYPSIQHEFPLVYGIGPYGLPSGVSDQRKVQALQLKSYLLAFEQVMANYLAQLSATNYLFSFNEHLNHTRFTQPITQLTGITSLINLPKGNVAAKTGGQHPAFIQQYRRILNKVWHRSSESAAQRLRILDHLLARFGESFDERLLNNLDYYLNPESLNKAKIRIKTNYLKQLPVLGADRVRAAGPSSKDDRLDWEPSGLEKRMRYQLGLLRTNNKSPLSLLRHHEVDTSSWLPDQETETDKVLLPEEGPDLVKLKHIGNTVQRPESRSAGRKIKPVTRLFNDLRNPDYDFFLNGIDEDNYYLKTVPGAHGQETTFELLYVSPVKQNRTLSVGRFHSWDKAIQEFRQLTTYLKQLHISTEGYRTVEHILLAPDVLQPCYGFEFRNRKREVLLEIKTPMSQRDIARHLQELLYARQPEKLISIHFSGGKYELFTGDPQQKICVHPKPLTDEAHADTLRNQIVQLIKEFKSGDFNPLHFFTHTPAQIFPSPFFSSQITVVLPAISARFNDEEFRMLAEQRFIDESPAHIYLNFLWLTAPEYEQFEKLYEIWQSDMLMGEHQVMARTNLAMWLFKKLNYPADITG